MSGIFQGQTSAIKSIQNISMSVSSGSTPNTTITAVVVAKTELVLNGWSTSAVNAAGATIQQLGQVGASLSITSTTNIAAAANAAAGLGPFILNLQVKEYY